jgi:hypothetical protein
MTVLAPDFLGDATATESKPKFAPSKTPVSVGLTLTGEAPLAEGGGPYAREAPPRERKAAITLIGLSFPVYAIPACLYPTEPRYWQAYAQKYLAVTRRFGHHEATAAPGHDRRSLTWAFAASAPP